MAQEYFRGEKAFTDGEVKQFLRKKVIATTPELAEEFDVSSTAILNRVRDIDIVESRKIRGHVVWGVRKGDADAGMYEFSDDVEGMIERIERKHKMDNPTQAASRLIEIGYREAKDPFVLRWKDQVINWAGILSILAMMSVAGGVVMPAYSPRSGVLMAGLLILMALGLVSAIELANRANGKYDFMARIRAVKP